MPAAEVCVVAPFVAPPQLTSRPKTAAARETPAAARLARCGRARSRLREAGRESAAPISIHRSARSLWSCRSTMVASATEMRSWLAGTPARAQRLSLATRVLKTATSFSLSVCAPINHSCPRCGKRPGPTPTLAPEKPSISPHAMAEGLSCCSRATECHATASATAPVEAARYAHRPAHGEPA